MAPQEVQNMWSVLVVKVQ